MHKSRARSPNLGGICLNRGMRGVHGRRGIECLATPACSVDIVRVPRLNRG